LSFLFFFEQKPWEKKPGTKELIIKKENQKVTEEKEPPRG